MAAPKGKHPGGRPKGSNLLSKIPRKQLELLYTAGLTDAQVADFYGVTEQTINNWKKADPGFFESLKGWKAQADGKVEESLYKRACGFVDTDGKEYPPDPTSMIFWLKNRKSREWRDKVDHEISGGVKVLTDIEDETA